ncbi:MAG: CapA family protein [Clostridia bacterium]|nr:CapA family protein [Clostridia bacterium]
MIKLTFLGDAMCKEHMLKAHQHKNGFDFNHIFERVKPLLEKSDYVFCNLETPISLNNTNLTSETYCFNSPLEYATAIKEAGINFVSTANNHCLDRGIEGIKCTIEALDKIGLKHTGISAYSRQKPQIVDVQGLKIGVMSYTYGTNAFANHCYLNKKQMFHVNLFQNQELSSKITRFFYHNKRNFFIRVYWRILRLFNVFERPLYEKRDFSLKRLYECYKDIRFLKRQKADKIIMLMHIGGQYNFEPTNYTKQITKWLYKKGVNIISGNHEHVVNGGIYDKIDKGFIATYSLGNFVSTNGVFDEPYDKLCQYNVAWHIYLDEKGNIQKTTLTLLKNIAKGEKIQVVPCVELLKIADDKQKLLEEMKIIADIFSGTDNDLAIIENNIELEI